MAGGNLTVKEADGTYASLKARSRAFALRIVHLVQSLPRDEVTRILSRQLLRAGTSVGANYRAACRARASAEFVAKLGIVEEEADETIYWLELVADAGSVKRDLRVDLVHEANDLLAIVVASIRPPDRGNSELPHSAFRIPHSAFRTHRRLACESRNSMPLLVAAGVARWFSR